MQLTDLKVLDTIGLNVTPKRSDFAAYMICGTPLRREYSWFNGGIKLVLTTIQSTQAIVSLAGSDAWLAGKSDATSLNRRIDNYLAAASVHSLQLDSKFIAVPGSSQAAWRNSDAYDTFVGQLTYDQFELVIQAYKLLRHELDELRAGLTPLA